MDTQFPYLRCNHQTSSVGCFRVWSESSGRAACLVLTMWQLLAPLLCILPLLVESTSECNNAPPCLGVICPGVRDDCTPKSASATLYFYGSEEAPLAQVANTTGKLMLNGKTGVADDNMSVQQFGTGCFNIYSSKDQRGECFHLGHTKRITLKDENYRKTKIK